MCINNSGGKRAVDPWAIGDVPVRNPFCLAFSFEKMEEGFDDSSESLDEFVSASGEVIVKIILLL